MRTESRKGKEKNDHPLCRAPTRSRSRILPFHDRATGPKGTKADPLTTPDGGKAGYSTTPSVFQGPVHYPVRRARPPRSPGAKDGEETEEMKIETRRASRITTAGGCAGTATNRRKDVETNAQQLEKRGVCRAKIGPLGRENGKFAFALGVDRPRRKNGGPRQYVGIGDTRRESVQS